MRSRRVPILVTAAVVLLGGVVVSTSFAGEPDVSDRGPTTAQLNEDGRFETIPPSTTADESVSPDVVRPGPSVSVPASSTPDDRPVVDVSAREGTVVLDIPDTIYDFGWRVADRDITIAADNVEARNIRGDGARRIGRRDGRDYVDSGFRDFEFTYMATENGDGGRLIRPYFIDGIDVNPDGLEAEGSPAHIYAYQGDVVEPLLEGITIRGWRVPEGSQAHNDAIHFTGIEGGRVFDPTLRRSSVVSGSALGVLLRHTYGLVTIEGSSFEARYGSFHAVLGNGEDVEEITTVLWRDNELVRSSTATFINGVVLDPRSDEADGVQVTS